IKGHRSAAINILSVLGSIQLNWTEGAILRTMPMGSPRWALHPLCLATDLESEGILHTALHPRCLATDLKSEGIIKEWSVSSVLTVISKLCEKHHGEFLNYSGEKISWMS
uniref:Uncharacterized protein n=1 Tax=Electrophorus electricus TaxID=8005 RepID=A0A4W4GIT8_ELEEL